MRGAPEKYVAISLVFLAGVAAAVYGVFLLLTDRHVETASLEAAGGFALLAWVIFHPARVPEHPGLEP